MPTTATQQHAGFAAFPFKDKIQRGIADLGFVTPRPIQAETIPAALDGRDVLGLAPTGTGKTAGFALPILQRLLEKHRPGPRALIVAPTRELAMQIDVEIRALAKHTRIKTATLFGGVSSQSQIRALRGAPDILVACPGRLLDLWGQGYVMLHTIEVLVLDEADHMFDMGFLPDITRVLNALPPRRQNLMFSATMPKEIRHLADDILKEPHVVELISNKPAETIEHSLFPVSQDQKPVVLEQLIDSGDFRSAIVFCRTKHRAKRLAEQLSRQGHRAIALQGNMTQGQRDRAMGGFRAGTFDILVATDIAARGIDVAAVSHVINFDVPTTPDAYTHRIGRTGRAELTGKAFTLVTPADRPLIRAIEKQLGNPIPRKKAPDVLDSAARETKSVERRARSAERTESPARGRREEGAPRPAQGRRPARRRPAAKDETPQRDERRQQSRPAARGERPARDEQPRRSRPAAHDEHPPRRRSAPREDAPQGDQRSRRPRPANDDRPRSEQQPRSGRRGSYSRGQASPAGRDSNKQAAPTGQRTSGQERRRRPRRDAGR